MKRSEIMAVARTQETDASCIGPKRGMARRGKRLGAKKVRQHLKETDAESIDIHRLTQGTDND